MACAASALVLAGCKDSPSGAPAAPADGKKADNGSTPVSIETIVAEAKGFDIVADDEAALKAVDTEIRKIVNDAAEFAQHSPEPDPAELWTDVLVGA